MPTANILKTDDDVRRGINHLTNRCVHMKRLHALTGQPPLRRRPAGFPGLARIITEQQLSTASAAAIWSRIETLADPFTAQSILALDQTQLRKAGLSRPKIKTLRALAEHIVDRRLNLTGLHRANPQTVSRRLTTVPGIGPWTADIYALFCLGFSDAFATGDLALQTTVQYAFGYQTRPSAKRLEELAENWRPWRGVAARLLWSSYPALRKAAETGTLSPLTSAKPESLHRTDIRG